MQIHFSIFVSNSNSQKVKNKQKKQVICKCYIPFFSIHNKTENILNAAGKIFLFLKKEIYGRLAFDKNNPSLKQLDMWNKRLKKQVGLKRNALWLIRLVGHMVEHKNSISESHSLWSENGQGLTNLWKAKKFSSAKNYKSFANLIICFK